MRLSHILWLFCLALMAVFPAQAKYTIAPEKPTLVFNSVDWAPFYSENMPDNGFLASVCREAYRRMGYELDILFVPWARALKDAQAGKVDGILGAYYTPERNDFFYFSDAVASTQDVFVVKSGFPQLHATQQQLTDYSVVGVRNSAQLQDAKDMGFLATEAVSFEHTLLMVNAKRADMGIVGLDYFRYYVNHLNPAMKNKLVDISTPFKTYNIHSLLARSRPGAKKLMAQFNQVVKGMYLDGSYQRLVQKFGMQAQAAPSKTLIQFE